MAALFALGVMSLGWMAFIAALIAVEKLLPWKALANRGIAVLLAGPRLGGRLRAGERPRAHPAGLAGGDEGDAGHGGGVDERRVDERWLLKARRDERRLRRRLDEGRLEEWRLNEGRLEERRLNGRRIDAVSDERSRRRPFGHQVNEDSRRPHGQTGIALGGGS